MIGISPNFPQQVFKHLLLHRTLRAAYPFLISLSFPSLQFRPLGLQIMNRQTEIARDFLAMTNLFNQQLKPRRWKFNSRMRICCNVGSNTVTWSVIVAILGGCVFATASLGLFNHDQWLSAI